MKIGDKVRFLNEVGGGIVKGFGDKDTVWVEDADGFDIPMLTKDCIVIETDNYNMKPRFSANVTPKVEEPILTYDVVEDDVPVKQVVVSAEAIRMALLERKGDTGQPKSQPPKSQPVEKLSNRNGIIEVDLHINALLDDISGMDRCEILNYQLDTFRRMLEQYKEKRGQRIIFIHGKGDGVLRKAILNELKRKYGNYSHQDASFQEYGFGATMVTIK
jgi:hypothetical protein